MPVTQKDDIDNLTQQSDEIYADEVKAEENQAKLEAQGKLVVLLQNLLSKLVSVFGG